MLTNQFIPINSTKKVINGEVSWSSPSNIALVKYWGKKENQIPENQSISFTLDTCKTITKLSYSKKQTENNDFSFTRNLLKLENTVS